MDRRPAPDGLPTRARTCASLIHSRDSHCNNRLSAVFS